MTRSGTYEDDEREWLEADLLGGFASGTVSGVRTRRYHALLCSAATPPTGRVVLVAGIEAWLEPSGGGEPLYLSSQRYAPDVVHPDGARHIAAFAHEPWPTWTYDLGGGDRLVQAIFCHRPSGDVVLSWRLESGGPRTLSVRPLLAARDYHALTHENGGFDFSAQVVGGNVAWRPYGDRPAITALSSGRYRHDPSWYRRFLYAAEERRGLDHLEDLASPGCFELPLSPGGEAFVVLRCGGAPWGDAASIAADHRARERGRRGDAVERAVDAYLVRRGGGLTVVAGYPWFTDWGRDTFIAIRGLCLAPGRPPRRLEQARQVLGAWAEATAASGGLVPNRFSDAGDEPELNAVDASLWFCVAAGELLERADLPADERRRLEAAVDAVLRAYVAGARYNIRCQEDGLVAAGEPGVQLTWMDAKVGDHVITPRIGKPVEIQALWINALAVGERRDPGWGELRRRATESFLERFPAGNGTLYDVVDADHRAGAVDSSFRPNQIFAVGGLPLPLLEGPAARALVDAVEERLWTPAGLRSLDPADPAYRPRYQGGVAERDGAYHQGTVWPWLAGPFIEAWLRVRGSTAAARAEARRRFVAPLEEQLELAGLGHVSEIADADPPHAPRGAPFQAWSLGELLRARSLTEEDT